MAAANFSRDVLENFYGDYIDWFMKTSVRHYPCDFLMIGKKERCGKSCEQFYCHDHDDYFKRGDTIPLPCICCGEGTIQYSQMCEYCEAEYGVGLK